MEEGVETAETSPRPNSPFSELPGKPLFSSFNYHIKYWIADINSHWSHTGLGSLEGKVFTVVCRSKNTCPKTQTYT